MALKNTKLYAMSDPKSRKTAANCPKVDSAIASGWLGN